MMANVVLSLSLLLCIVLLLAQLSFSFVNGKLSLLSHKSSLFRLNSETPRYLDDVREGVEEAGFQNAWKDSATLLAETAAMETEEAEVCLAQAWNWKNWAVCTSSIARKYIKPKEPHVSTITESLDWIQNGPLQFNQDQMRTAIIKSPEAYLTSPEETYTEALKVAPKEFRNPSDFNTLLQKDPTALQCTYNCEDTGCNSDCGNCWVAYRKR